MSHSISLNSQNRYEIKVCGQLDDSWLSWFGEAKVRIEVLADNSQMTTFSNVFMDQAALVGLIRRLHGLGIVLISIVGCEPGDWTVSKDVPNDTNSIGSPIVS